MTLPVFDTPQLRAQHEAARASARVTLDELRDAVALLKHHLFKVEPVCLKCRDPWRGVEPTTWLCWSCYYADCASTRAGGA